MKFYRTAGIALGIVVLGLAFASHVAAADPWIGTWVQKSGPVTKSQKGEFTMTVEAWGANGCKLTYRISGIQWTSTVESPMDGTDVPVVADGKPTSETMAIKRLDDHHMSAVLKVNGKQYGVSRGTLSADSNTLTVEEEFTSDAGGTQPGKHTEVWVRK